MKATAPGGVEQLCLRCLSASEYDVDHVFDNEGGGGSVRGDAGGTRSTPLRRPCLILLARLCKAWKRQYYGADGTVPRGTPSDRTIQKRS